MVVEYATHIRCAGGCVADAFAGAALRPLCGGLPGAGWGCGMSETKHTPGPWEVRTDGELFAICGPAKWIVTVDVDEEGNIALQDGTSEYEVNQANANLIAAAPDLLAALERALPSLCKCGSRDCYETEVHQQAVAAIAEAKGETP